VAVAGPRCLYCGAPLPTREASAEEARAPAEERTALVIDTTPGAAVLASALGITVAEAGYRVGRGRFVLHRILPHAAADAEAARLERGGVATMRVPEQEIRAGLLPLFARSGDPESGTFVVEPERSVARVAPEAVLLVVWGPIRHETSEPDAGPMRGWRRLSPPPRDRELYHLHLRDSSRPIEIDPWAFRFSETRGRIESSLLRMRTALETLAGTRPVDRSFRFEPPAMGPSQSVPEGPGDAESRLLKSAHGSRRRASGATDLDNTSQFRFHSSWLAAVTRRLG